ncbi:MAG TPA: VWA domain-containing protein [Candidatus Tectomicrobia bacterium]|nr:VWA domain-containing protein [Candidatus Tectomicrobia bacterium]
MKRFRYSAWDGTQTFADIEADDVLDEAVDDLLQHGDLTWAMRRLFEQGLTLRGQRRVEGIRDLIRRLQRMKQETTGQFDVQPLFEALKRQIGQLTQERLAHMSRMLQALNELLRQRDRGLSPSLDEFLRQFGQYFPNLEQADLDTLMQELQAQMRQMQELLDAMPDDMRQALAQLMQQKFSDPKLQQQLAQLAEQWERFSELTQHGFRGNDPLSIEEGLRMADRFDLIEQLEQAIRRLPRQDRLAEIDMERLRDLLGDEAHERVERLKELVGLLEKAGYVHRVGDRYELTPRGIRKLGERALRHIFAVLERGQFGPHETSFHGHGDFQHADATKPYEYGDRFHPDLGRTFLNALSRQGYGTPVKVKPEDFEVYRPEFLTRSTTVLMLDMSLSMEYYGRFPAAKKVTIALHTLMKSQFPRDSLKVIGFYSYAEELHVEDLPFLVIDGITPGTNLQHGFMLARKWLGRQAGPNKHIIVITDGQPTVHHEGGQWHFHYPPTHATLRETLKEAKRVTDSGIQLSVFMLDDDPLLVAFVDQMTRLNRGRAFYVTSETLGKYLLVDYLRKKRVRV